MQPAEQFPSISQKFLEVGCTIEFNAQNRVVSASSGTFTQEYNLPPLLQANGGVIPGWYLAGIWNNMGLPDRPLSQVDIQYYFSGWGFISKNDSSLWIKTLPGDNSKVLIYYNFTFFIAPNEESVWMSNYLPQSADGVSLIPVSSIYHVVKLMEARGWFDNPESYIPSQDIEAYRR